MLSVTGIISGCLFSRPMIPVWRSCTNAPAGSVVLTVLKALSGAGMVATTGGLSGRAHRTRQTGPRSGSCAPRTLVERVDLEHVGDRCHAGDRLFRKFSNTECQGTGQLAVEIHGAAAHASHDAGVFRFFAMQTDQDDVSLGSVHVLEDTQDFDVHGFGLHALEHRQRVTAHAGVNLTDWNCFGYRNLTGGFFSGQRTKIEQ